MNKKILALAVPNIISNITIPLVGMVNMAIVGRLGVDSMIGAMAMGTAIFNFIYWNFAFLRMGTSGFVAQAYGGRDFGEIAAILVRAVSVGAVSALLLLIFQGPVGKITMSMMNGSDVAMSYAAEYFYVRIWAAPATISLFAFHGWFIGMQNSRFPMYISIIINAINVVLGIWFALGMGMGIKGVAWAVVIAQYSGLITAIVLWVVYYRRFWKYIDFKTSLKLKPMVRFFSVNRDIFLRTACVVTVYTFFTSASSSMGDTLLAINALLMQLFTLFSYMMDGFAYAAESLIGRYVGARNNIMVQRYLKYLLFWSLGVALFCIAGYSIFWRDILTIFTSSADIVNGAGQFIIWIMLVPLVGFAPFLIDGALIGATLTSVMRDSVAIATIGFFAIYYSLLGTMGNDALWLAFILFLVMRGVLLYFMTNRLRITTLVKYSPSLKQ